MKKRIVHYSQDELQQGSTEIIALFYETMFHLENSKLPQDSQKVKVSKKKSVTSVQYKKRTRSARSLTADGIAQSYFKWLYIFTKRSIKMKQNETKQLFCLLHRKFPLIILQKEKTNSRFISKWRVDGGLLVKKKGQQDSQASFYFIYDENNSTIFTALISFRPRLPWGFYKLTQGRLHPMIMRKFLEGID